MQFDPCVLFHFSNGAAERVTRYARPAGTEKAAPCYPVASSASRAGFVHAIARSVAMAPCAFTACAPSVRRPCPPAQAAGLAAYVGRGPRLSGLRGVRFYSHGLPPSLDHLGLVASRLRRAIRSSDSATVSASCSSDSPGPRRHCCVRLRGSRGISGAGAFEVSRPVRRTSAMAFSPCLDKCLSSARKFLADSAGEETVRQQPHPFSDSRSTAANPAVGGGGRRRLVPGRFGLRRPR